jgi:signal peptidase II
MRPGMISFTTRIVVFLLVAASCFGCDRIMKIAARDGLQGEAPRSFLGGMVVLQYEENQGAMLSIGAGLPGRARFLLFTVGISLVLAIIALLVLFRSRAIAEIASGALAIGGGFGNLVDRLTSGGSVIDFVSVGVGPLRTAVFNWADVAILGGVAIYVVVLSRRGAGSRPDRGS